MTTQTTRRLSLGALLGMLLALLVALPVAPAMAATGSGWVRVAHMSPDTSAVNVSLSSLNGKTVWLRLKNVKYGAVSQYAKLPAGTYALAMRPSGSANSDSPIVSGTVKVSAGKAKTVVARGLNKNLKLQVLNDTLANPKKGNALVRVMQASTTQDNVTVSTGSTTLASDAALGDVSKYTNVAAGSKSFSLRGDAAVVTATERLSAGSAYTLFVLDTAAGKLTTVKALDSVATAIVPTGSVAAGGGWLATHQGFPAGGLLVVLTFAGLAAAAVLVARRRQVSS